MSTVLEQAVGIDQAAKAKRHDLYLLVTRVFLSLAVAFVSWGVGLLCGQYLSQFVPINKDDPNSFTLPFTHTTFPRGWIATVVGITTGGLFVKWCTDVVGALPVFWEPIEKAWKEGLSPHAKTRADVLRTLYHASLGNFKTLSLLWATAMTVALSASTWLAARTALDTKVENQGKAEHTPGLQPTPPTTGGPSSDPYQRSFVVYFQENSREALKRWDFHTGLTLAEKKSTEVALSLFAKRLAYCNQGGHAAKVLVKGFASSSGDDPQNLALANERARLVAQMLSGINTDVVDRDADQPPPPLTASLFTAHSWGQFVEMERERGFSDRVKDRYSPNRGQLNRRAEIRIISAASCQQ